MWKQKRVILKQATTQTPKSKDEVKTLVGRIMEEDESNARTCLRPTQDSASSTNVVTLQLTASKIRKWISI